jgi:maltose alpha-D-glucosyltransferase/alpha-amylase
MNNDRRKIELMNSLLFTLPGAPTLYYGDEIGMGDDISLPDRNGVRTPMQWSSGLNGGFSSAAPDTLYSPVISDPVYGYQRVNVESQRADEDSLLHKIRRMIHTRHQLPVLARGELEWLDSLPKQALCFWRKSSNGAVLALHNLSDHLLDIPVPDGAQLRDALEERVGAVNGTVTLEAYDYRWLVSGR